MRRQQMVAGQLTRAVTFTLAYGIVRNAGRCILCAHRAYLEHWEETLDEVALRIILLPKFDGGVHSEVRREEGTR